MTVEELVAVHSPAVRRLVEDVRTLVHRTLPGMTERVYPGWHALGFRAARAGYVCGIFPFEDHVHLLFEHGARLDDPDGLLEGDTLKQVRYVVLRPGTRLPRPALRRLLLAALHHGSLRAAHRRR